LQEIAASKAGQLLAAMKNKEKAMATINGTSVVKGRKAEAVATESGQGDKHLIRMTHAMLLVALAMFGATIATHAFADNSVGADGLGFNAGLRAAHMGRSFSAPIVDEPLSTPAPQFNPSEPYTIPQSPEIPVSPASPGSVFGNG
jgi:hypothetical protein